MSKIVTYGSFDLFHYGHLQLLRRAKKLGDELIVYLSTDEFHKEKKGKPPVFPFDERVEILDSIKFVDEVREEHSMEQKYADLDVSYMDAGERLRHMMGGGYILVMGMDWAGKFDNVPCDVVYLPRTPGVSTTIIKDKIIKYGEFKWGEGVYPIEEDRPDE